MPRALRALLPGVLAAGAAAAAIWWLESTQLATLASRYALVLYAVGALAGVAFHRSRVVIGVSGLAFLQLAAIGGAQAGARFAPMATFVLGLFGLLSLVRDRGVASRIGLMQVGVAATVAGGGYFLSDDLAFLEAFETARPLAIDTTVVGVPQIVLLVGLASAAAGIYGTLRWRGPVERALLWAQLFLLTAVHPWMATSGAGVLLMAGGLVLVVAVVETSYSMAYLDELTGLPGRRALMRDLAQVGGTYTVAMVDVDHFKQFNDKHGHDVGDQVLQLVAKHLGAGEGGGRAYRYGGEEFTLFYPGRVRDDAIPHADAVREAVEDATFSLRAWNRPRKKPQEGKKPKKRKRARKLSVTVSVGVADSSGKQSSTEEVLKQADEALYRAKRDGRNRVSK